MLGTEKVKQKGPYKREQRFPAESYNVHWERYGRDQTF